MHKLAKRIRAAYARTERGRQEWIEGMLELAAALADGRKRFEADRQFSLWLAENELDVISKDDWAALIKLGDLPFARSVLEAFADRSSAPIPSGKLSRRKIGSVFE